jgi:diguanylate cyclase (GGDEF)-like protein
MNSAILLVDDDPGTIQLLGRVLSDLGEVRFATSGEVALQIARGSTLDLILLDAEMPGLSGFQVCKSLKLEPMLASVPVIFVTSHADVEFEVAGFELGAVDFITKPINPPLVRSRVKLQLQVKRMADELRRVSVTDVVTGVANRRKFDESLEREWRRARRKADPLALLMIDVDHFKLFNDHYGHTAGDACLRRIAQAISRASARPADLVARYGGEEFVALLPLTPRAGAAHVALAVLDAVAALCIEHIASSTAPYLTVSIGAASYDEESDGWALPSSESRFMQDLGTRCSPTALVQAADAAMYSAKRAGRARARLLDIADVDAPQMARDIVPPLFDSHSTRQS